MNRNPGASVDFSSGTIKDVGRDGGGIYRNISRDLRIPDFLSKSQFLSLSWSQVCCNLLAQRREDRVQVRLSAMFVRFLKLFAILGTAD
jgi:hypothetical protein